MVLAITLCIIFFGICCFSEDIKLLRSPIAEENVEQGQFIIASDNEVISNISE